MNDEYYCFDCERRFFADSNQEEDITCDECGSTDVGIIKIQTRSD